MPVLMELTTPGGHASDSRFFILSKAYAKPIYVCNILIYIVLRNLFMSLIRPSSTNTSSVLCSRRENS